MGQRDYLGMAWIFTKALSPHKIDILIDLGLVPPDCAINSVHEQI